jgi:hypothetical protein
MDTCSTAHVYLEAMESAKSSNKKSGVTRHSSREGLPKGNTRQGCWRTAQSPVLNRSLTNWKLQEKGYYSLAAEYARIH